MDRFSPLVNVTLAATATSTLICLVLGYYYHRRTKRLGDLIPVERGREASVRSGTEFSSATVAATVSLATVIMAFFELAGAMGTWLLWTVVTTALGILAVRLAAPSIIHKLAKHGTHIPTLHEFLGTEFASPRLALIGALATTFGYVGAWAVELSVGSRLFAGLGLPIPAWAIVLFFTLVGITYTAMGGFRVVIVTDRIQMIAIWLSLAAFLTYFMHSAARAGGIAAVFTRLPHAAWDFSAREGLAAFLVGIAIINIPSFVSDQAMWQRITSAQEPSTIRRGLVWSAVSAGITWSFIAVVAIWSLAFGGSGSSLAGLLATIGNVPTVWNVALLFVIISGLIAAMLSTASTLLIALSHTFKEDVLGHRGLSTRTSRSELRTARLALTGLAGVSVLLVEGLSRLGFSIADLVFAIYGSQLALFPPVVAALTLPAHVLRAKSAMAAAAVALGFLGGWMSAAVGRLGGHDNLVFLAPAVSLAVSGIILGLAFTRGTRTRADCST